MCDGFVKLISIVSLTIILHNIICNTFTPQIKGIHRDTWLMYPWFISLTKGTSKGRSKSSKEKLSRDTSECTLVYIWMYPGKVNPLNSLIHPLI